VAPATVLSASAAWRGALASLPTVLKVMWTIWLAAVSVNVIVWVLVSGTTGHLAYPWPLWVAGPYGAVLFAVSAGVTQSRRSRPLAGRCLPAGRGPAGEG
jgi:NhaP-type Na+/H+ or K+/H+ antiporter